MHIFLKKILGIFKPDFLINHYKNLEYKETFKYWFLINTVLTAILSIVIFFAANKAVDEGVDYLEQNYSQAKITLNGGKLSTEGIQEPVFIKGDDNAIFVVDTNGKKYDENILKDFDSGVFISDSEMVSKKNSIETRKFDFSQIKNNFSLTEKDLISFTGKIKFVISLFIFGLVWIYLNLFRLVSAFWWALLFWILALVMNVKGMDYMKTYFAVLNFYIIPLLGSMLLGIFNVTIPFLTTIIFIIIFVANYLNLKKLNISNN